LIKIGMNTKNRFQFLFRVPLNYEEYFSDSIVINNSFDETQEIKRNFSDSFLIEDQISEEPIEPPEIVDYGVERIAIALNRQYINILDRQGTITGSIPAIEGCDISLLELSPNGQKIAVNYSNGDPSTAFINVYELNGSSWDMVYSTGGFLFNQFYHWSEDSRYLSFLFGMGSTNIIDTNSYQSIIPAGMELEFFMVFPAFTPDSQKIILSGQNSVKVYDIATSQIETVLTSGVFLNTCINGLALSYASTNLSAYSLVDFSVTNYFQQVALDYQISHAKSRPGQIVMLVGQTGDLFFLDDSLVSSLSRSTYTTSQQGVSLLDSDTALVIGNGTVYEYGITSQQPAEFYSEYYENPVTHISVSRALQQAGQNFFLSFDESLGVNDATGNTSDRNISFNESIGISSIFDKTHISPQTYTKNFYEYISVEDLFDRSKKIGTIESKPFFEKPTVDRKARKFVDLDLMFGKNPATSDSSLKFDDNAVKQSIKNIVLTNNYERLFQPDIGCQVSGMMFELFSPVTKVIMEKTIINAINNFEPRAILLGVTVIEERDKNGLMVEIVFKIRNSETPIKMNLNLKRTR